MFFNRAKTVAKYLATFAIIFVAKTIQKEPSQSGHTAIFIKYAVRKELRRPRGHYARLLLRKRALESSLYLNLFLR